MWHPCEYQEWRGDLPWAGGQAVFACVWPMDRAPASVKWVELYGEAPRDAEATHHAARMLAFWEWEDARG